MPCSVGRGGIGVKRGEGDGVTPIGTFQLVGIGLRTDRMSFEAPHISQKSIGLGDVWSDDPKDPDYNHGLHSPNHPFSHERLYRADGLYDALGILDFNWPNAQPGAGSAIFLHIWRKPRHPTEGCVAFERNNLVGIFQNWKPWSRVIVRG